MLTGPKKPEERPIRQNSGNRVETAREGFPHDGHIWPDVFVLAGKELTGATQPGLDFIRNQQDVVLAADFSHALEIAHRRDNDPRLALDRLQHHGRRVGGDGFLKSG